MHRKLKSITRLLTIVLFCCQIIVGCSTKNDSKFLGLWINNTRGNGLNYGATVSISNEGEVTIIRFDPKSGITPLQNTGTFKDGRLNVTLPYAGNIDITYIEENKKPHIYFMGAKLDKVH